MTTYAAKALIFYADKLLVLRRSSTHPHWAFQPDLPGGMIETDETPEVGLSREILEETGLDIPITKANLVYEKHIRTFDYHYIYLVRLDGDMPELNISWEHDQYSWQTINEIIEGKYPEDLDHFFVEVVDYLKTIKDQ
ncbi:MAG TPA: NUDIX hydrolase [Candidatus Saccharimonadales bacterium]